MGDCQRAVSFEVYMKYTNTIRGVFLDRPNRFTAHVKVNGSIETVHVKNTGRCRELLVEGADVILSLSDNEKRKTRYDLVGVYKPSLGMVNIDSQAPNIVVREWLLKQDYDVIVPEYTWGNSRFDFYMEKDHQKYLLEIKGCTLEVDGVGYFPDAPSLRAVKHVEELIKAQEEGFVCAVGFVIAMNGVNRVMPNMKTHPAFGEALKKAEEAGVDVLYFECLVEEDGLSVVEMTRAYI